MGFFDNLSKKMEEKSEKKKQAKAEYKEVLDRFKNDDAKKFENYYFDLKTNQILEIQNVFSKKYRIIDFKDILSYSINKKEHNDSKTETKRKHGIGRAVVGGVLLGPVGAAVGGLTSKKETQTISKDFVDHLGVVVNLNDGTSFEIEYFDTTLKADDSLVTGCIKQVNQLTTVLEAGIENAKRQQTETVTIKPKKVEENNEQPVQSASPAADPLDKIKKLKGLLDIGAITQEEFDAKKKQLLDL
ncbi:SHOCT domain-containing protein [Lactobacillus gasseri]|uniref:SHOCT domain-containing protein n=1 Tax=Lactobacillus gasseri TaxID=1596 RepID=UPI000E42DE01|nr:SHOCT domain-containing protein [Lactobacillus gasseri]MCZ3944380.1 SHOCT domain-containing protein [Lactobacillus gasseri]MCZ3947118.1 SHOCT domain-containing protein [Lactobacillus gasseri]MCZ3980978.1 SHOCT domain-containing protein [Lactobacillus gasseri]MCZ3995138.1 SHOCT domain-containing protein [Lactobacillus gasseri]MCZ4003356.1 SHOCT domain-containing protein [Lactobacillus gasseri]